VVEVGGWRTRRHGGTFTPVGVMVHHTGSDNSSMLTIRDGHSRLAGPLAQLYVEQKPAPKVWLISQGKCWHAGQGSEEQLTRTRAGLAPLPDTPQPEDGNGNAFYWGVEVEGDTPDDFADERYRLAVRCVAAILDGNGWGPERVIAHKEWTKRKVDPAFQMNVFRGNVADELWRHNEMGQFTDHEVEQLKNLVAALDGLVPPSSGHGFAKWGVDLIRRERLEPLHRPLGGNVLRAGENVTITPVD